MSDPGPEGPAPAETVSEEALTDDSLLDGRIRLFQLRRGHRAGSDAVLLAAAVGPEGSEGGTVVDVGAGTGAVGLMIGARRPVSVVLVERDPTLAAICRRNVERNGLGGQARVVETDVLAPDRERRHSGLLPASADAVVTNPPFLDPGRSRPSPDALRAAAHHLPAGGIADWIRACAALLKPKGTLVLIHRADRLDECLAPLRGFGAVALKAIHPRADEPASRILVAAVKGSRAPMRIVAPLVLHGADGRFTAEAEAIHRGEALLPM